MAGGGWGAGGTLFKAPGGTPAGLPRIASVTAQPNSRGGVPPASARAPGVPAAPWTAPPVPAGFYNPVRDIEESEGKRGSEQALTGDERTRSVDENSYSTNLALLQQKETAQAQAAQETLARLAESYKKLGVRQAEGANQKGVISGGALLQSAMKRAANEGVTKSADETARQQQLQGDENERGRLATDESNLVGPGGSLTEAMQNARVNQQAFDEGITTLKGDEASQNGYVAPTAPRARPASGAPRIVSQRAQPSSGGGAPTGRSILAAARRKARL